MKNLYSEIIKKIFKKRSTQIKSNKGFSLVELVITIAIMAILASSATVALIRYIEKAREAKDVKNARLIADVVIQYAAESDWGDTAAGSGTYENGNLVNGTGVYNRSYVYVSGRQVRCSNQMVADALVEAGLLEGATHGGWNTEVIFENQELRVHARKWKTYQVDIDFSDNGEVRYGASAIAYTGNTQTNGASMNDKLSKEFSRRIGGQQISYEVGD